MGDVDYLTNVKKWLVTQFKIKYLDMRNVFSGIQIVQNRKNKSLVMTQESYINKMLFIYKMHNFKRVGLSLRIF